MLIFKVSIRSSWGALRGPFAECHSKAPFKQGKACPASLEPLRARQVWLLLGAHYPLAAARGTAAVGLL